MAFHPLALTDDQRTVLKEVRDQSTALRLQELKDIFLG
jgi:hypothetical protein